MAAMSAHRSCRLRCSGAAVAPRSRGAAPRVTAHAEDERRRRSSEPSTRARRRIVAARAFYDGAARDVMCSITSAVAAAGVIRGAAKLVRAETVDRKLTRKLVHILSGPAFLFAWTLYSNDPSARYVASVVALLYLLRLLSVGTQTKEGVEVATLSREGGAGELLRGPTYYTAVIAITVLNYWRTPTGVAILSFMCAGDGLADVVGRRWGANNKWPFNTCKSVAGSAAMLIGGSFIATTFCSLYDKLGYFEMDAQRYACVLAMSAVATAVEVLPVNGASRWLDDNISVPLVTALLGSMWLG